MTELHITDPKPFEDDLFNEKSLRPVKLEDFIGQNELVDSLSPVSYTHLTLPTSPKV